MISPNLHRRPRRRPILPPPPETRETSMLDDPAMDDDEFFMPFDDSPVLQKTNALSERVTAAEKRVDQEKRARQAVTELASLLGPPETSPSPTSVHDVRDESPPVEDKELPRTHSMPLARKSSFKSSNSLRRNVSFGRLETREFSIALSDHPSCSYGPPIQLGWEYRDRVAVPLESVVQSPKRTGPNVLSYHVRRKLLLKQYQPEELVKAMNEVERVKRERHLTGWSVMAVDEALENMREAVQRVFR